MNKGAWAVVLFLAFLLVLIVYPAAALVIIITLRLYRDLQND